MPNTYIQYIDPYVKEKGSISVNAYFRDSTNAASAPTTVHYRIDCLTTGTKVLDWTSVSPAVSVTISVTSSQNAIISDNNARERKQITVSADKGTTTETRDTAFWICENIEGFSG